MLSMNCIVLHTLKWTHYTLRVTYEVDILTATALIRKSQYICEGDGPHLRAPYRVLRIEFDKYYKGQKGHGETKNDVMKEITALVI